ncbi:membrane-spanning 4-domains subfamily A member 4A-like [Acipenser ruthenus]|uniref:membrane-spanning 4-domains subfamily A member 4A-like n=1 Tax=Acipenser ruthenus TaxID=7906 RepID=UPI002742073D|nr:membrane-spanning 4-domains subfamily A member 4A-like [Acipenser ruthenus]
MWCYNIKERVDSNALLTCTSLTVSVVTYNNHGLQWKSYMYLLQYIISGSLAVAAENTPRRDLVKACLGMNIVSSVFAGVGSILYSIRVSVVPFQMVYFNTPLYVGILAVLLVLNILEMCITITTSAFGCKSECRYIAMPEVAFQQA